MQCSGAPSVRLSRYEGHSVPIVSGETRINRSGVKKLLLQTVRKAVGYECLTNLEPWTQAWHAYYQVEYRSYLGLEVLSPYRPGRYSRPWGLGHKQEEYQYLWPSDCNVPEPCVLLCFGGCTA
jgi:hypothetical protein